MCFKDQNEWRRKTKKQIEWGKCQYGFDKNNNEKEKSNSKALNPIPFINGEKFSAWSVGWVPNGNYVVEKEYENCDSFWIWMKEWKK